LLAACGLCRPLSGSLQLSRAYSHKSRAGTIHSSKLEGSSHRLHGSWRRSIAAAPEPLQHQSEDCLVKIRDAKPEELVRPARARELSPRQRAAQEREVKFRKLLERLNDPAQIKAIEPERGEKLSTLRASLAKVLQGDHRGAHMAVKRGVIYVSLGPIPGARRAGRPRE
jgi:hypothetical protein